MLSHTALSVSPRNCISQNLARAEICAMSMRLVWRFDFEMMDMSRDWEDQKVFILWSRPSSLVKLYIMQKLVLALSSAASATESGFLTGELSSCGVMRTCFV
jgi:hypothetical protein